MNVEEKVKAKLLSRGFKEKQLLNNRGLIGAAIDETQEVVKNINYDTVLATVPYQKCPVCEGMGQIFVNQLDPYNTNSSIGYKQCHVCGGSGIIPMHVLPCNKAK